MFISYDALSQACEDRVDKASIMYEKGQFQNVIDTLTSCQYAEDKAVRIGANRLMALSYLALNREDAAREAAKEILRTSPDYRPSLLENSTEFIKLIEGIVVIPRFSAGISVSLGTNITLPQVIEVHSIAEHTDRQYVPQAGFDAAISNYFQINRTYGVFVNLTIKQKKFGSEYPINNLDLSHKETNYYAVLPVGLRYRTRIEKKWLNPFFDLGVYGGYLLRSKSDFFYTDTDINQEYSILNVDNMNRRVRGEAGVYGGIGTFIGLGSGFLNLSIYGNYSMTTTADPKQRYSNSNLTNNYLYVDDDIKLHSLSFMVGYNLILKYKVLD